MRGRSPSAERQPRYRYTEEEEEEYIRRTRSRSHCRCRASPCKCCPPPQHPPKPCQPVTIQVHDRTTHDPDPHGRSFTITLEPETAAADIMYSLAPPRSGCVVLICWGHGRRCLLDPRDDMLEVARRCWLEIVDAQ